MISVNTGELTMNIFASQMCLSTVPNSLSTLIRQVNAKNCFATRRFLNVRKENFVIQHYCGTVQYSAYDLLSKNTDKVNQS